MLLFALLQTLLLHGLFRQKLTRSLSQAFELSAVQVANRIEGSLDEFRRTLDFASALPALNSEEFSPETARRLLQMLKNETPAFAWIGFLDYTGRVTAATGRILEGESAQLRPWFNDLTERGVAARMEIWPALEEKLQRPERPDELPQRVFLAVRVPGATGAFRDGALVAQLDWHWARQAQRAVIPDSASAVQLGATVYSGPAEIVVDSGGSGWTFPPNAPEIPALRGGHGSQIEDVPGGGQYLTAYALTSKYPNLNWVVAVRQPTELSFAPIRKITAFAIRWTLLIMGIGLPVCWYFADRLTRRLRSVAATARRMQSGDVLTVMPSSRDHSDVEQMCGAINELVEDLRKQRDEAVEKSSASIVRK